VTLEDVQSCKNLNTASYAMGIPGLIIWLIVFARILYYKAKMQVLIMICLLMILYWIAVMILCQARYTRYRKEYEGVDDVTLYIQLEQAATFLNIVAFNQAHWSFAFKYWVVSWRMDLIQRKMSPEKYNARL